MTSSQGAAAPPRRTKPGVIRKRADFLKARGGARANMPGFLLLKRKRSGVDPEIRIGLTVTKKLGGAVARNRIRRRLRHAAREIAPVYGEPGCDYVLIARGAALKRQYSDLLDDLKRALLRLSRTPT